MGVEWGGSYKSARGWTRLPRVVVARIARVTAARRGLRAPLSPSPRESSRRVSPCGVETRRLPSVTGSALCGMQAATGDGPSLRLALAGLTRVHHSVTGPSGVQPRADFGRPRHQP